MEERTKLIYKANGNATWSNFVNLYFTNQEIFEQEYTRLYNDSHSTSMYSDGRALVFNHNNGKLLYGIWFTLDYFDIVVVE